MVRRHTVKNYRREDGTPVHTHQRGKGTGKTPSKRGIAEYLNDAPRCPLCDSGVIIDKVNDTVMCSYCGATWESIDSFKEETGVPLETIKEDRYYRLILSPTDPHNKDEWRWDIWSSAGMHEAGMEANSRVEAVKYGTEMFDKFVARDKLLHVKWELEKTAEQRKKENVEAAISKASASLDLVCEQINERMDALEQQLDADQRKTTYKWVV